MLEQMNFSNASVPVTSVLNSINTVNFGGLDLQPTYQRGYVWKDDFKDKLIYSIIKSYPTGNISVRVLKIPNAKGAKSEVVDGQQRLTTIRDFVSNQYIIKSEWSKKIIEVIKNYYESAGVQDETVHKLVKKLNNKGNVRLKFNDLPEIIKGNINSYNIPMTYIADSTDQQVREYFRFLQNQERLRAGEIINSMPATNLEVFLDNISHKNMFLDIIGFSDDRAEFDKIFYSIIGLFDSKISFGTTDKTIQSYAAKAETPTIGLDKVNTMVEQINSIISVGNSVLTVTRKRFLKYLLLLSGLKLVDFSTDTVLKLKTLKNIDDKLSVFFSAKANVIEEEYKGYSEAVIEEMRLIALLTKGGHSLSRVENRMRILAYYVNNEGNKTIPSQVKLIEE
ncbi:DUF262 domain-containing protein [Ruminococcus sp.]|jgi:hypothetical protein|uniref:DUF262 domain-containing protein n=1 Tax=uncultured Ruminococcus sp. TaxID=165186 RepID=UPI0026655D41|nr:DUF262 domain-containing protein [uncultured Ruminococcus sp.]